MSKRKNNNGNGADQAQSCPHCGTGADGITLGLHWDTYDQCWRCVICGFREYTRQPRTDAEITADRFWEDVMEGMEREDGEAIIVDRLTVNPESPNVIFSRYSICYPE